MLYTFANVFIPRKQGSSPAVLGTDHSSFVRPGTITAFHRVCETRKKGGGINARTMKKDEVRSDAPGKIIRVGNKWPGMAIQRIPHVR